MIGTYLLSKKIHRLLVLLMLFLTLIMAGTGIMLKYLSFFDRHFHFIDLGLVRYLHNNLSIVFTIVLLLMALTGTIMYFIPYIQSRKAVIPPKNNEQNQVN